MEGTLIWKPTKALIRKKPYIIAYRVSDGIYTNDYTVLYTIEGENTSPGPGPGTTTSIEESSTENIMRIYPNPANDILNIDVDYQNKTLVNIEVYDIYGSLKYTNNVMYEAADEKISLDDLNLNTGSYILVLKSNQKIDHHGKFVVQK